MALSTAASASTATSNRLDAATGSFPFASVNLVGQDDSVAIDQDLFQSFSVDSLMELAGLSVAEVVLKCFSPTAATAAARPPPRVLVVVGPGNNGGDGLVAARHLRHFGYTDITLFYPKQSQKPLFQNLIKQNEALGNTIIADPDFDPDDLDTSYDIVIDAVFGFSFKGAPRAPFVNILRRMASTSLPVVSVDVPSGYVWRDAQLCPFCVVAAASAPLFVVVVGGSIIVIIVNVVVIVNAVAAASSPVCRALRNSTLACAANSHSCVCFVAQMAR